MLTTRRQFLTTAAGLSLAPAILADETAKPRKLVIIAGTPSHGPGDHEFNAGVQLLAKCLKSVPGIHVDVVLNGYPKDEAILFNAQAICVYADGGGRHPLIQEKRLETFKDLMSRGVGLMCCHYAVEVPKDRGADELRAWIGGAYETNWSCNPMWVAEFRKLPDHPITRGVQPFAIRDEWYFNMRFRENNKGIIPILTAIPSDATRDGPYVAPRGPYPHIQAAKGREEHLMWAVEREDGGRGVGFTGGHFHKNWQDNNFRKAVLNALVWITKVEVPKNGVESAVTDTEMTANLDPKPPRKK